MPHRPISADLTIVVPESRISTDTKIARSPAVAARGQFKASKPTANTATPASGSPSESALAVRLVAARDIALGLLMRDTTASVVVRALQAGPSSPSLSPSMLST